MSTPSLKRLGQWLRHRHVRPHLPAHGDCALQVDGRPVRALTGQSVAAVLVRERVWRFRDNPVSSAPRGPYCGMGVCFDCELDIDDVTATQACMVAVRDGMIIRTDRRHDAPADLRAAHGR